MSDKNAKLTPEEMKLIEETESFMKEVYSDPEIANAQIPESLRANVFREIRAKEENQESERVLTEEEQELIYLGKKSNHQHLLQNQVFQREVLQTILQNTIKIMRKTLVCILEIHQMQSLQNLAVQII